MNLKTTASFCFCCFLMLNTCTYIVPMPLDQILGAIFQLNDFTVLVYNVYIDISTVYFSLNSVFI